MRTRESGIDVIKFFLSIVILLYHWGLGFGGGYLAVEGFFMISGFLMLRSLCKRQAQDGPDGTARFLLRKYGALFLPLLFSALLGFWIYESLIEQRTLLEMAKNLPLLLYEIFPMQVAGLPAMHTTGVSWYVSAMLLAMAILHPLAKRDPRRFSFTVAPLIALLGYGLIAVGCGQLDAPNTRLLSGLVSSGLVRALAGISAGGLLFALCPTEQQGARSAPSRILFTALELGGWAFIAWAMNAKGVARGPMDFVTMAALFGVLYVALSKRSVFALLLHHRWTAVLAACSTYTFLNHYAWVQYLRRAYPEGTTRTLLPRYLALVALSSALVFALCTGTRAILGACKAKKNDTQST